ncbi:MAG: hypothetical protein J0M17_09490 [Planctomycetes bacterium]|nr:hypothetical protein [Planctomycetota bacterium]
MIQPEDIRQKAERLYPKFLREWLDGNDAFFPRVIPSNRDLNGATQARAAEQVQRLREASKEVLGYGYSVTWEERRSRDFGRNLFPVRISFETAADFLRYLRRLEEFERFRRAVTQTCDEFPVLRPWIRSQTRAFLGVVEEVDGLLHVLRYLRDHPRPDVFARELPLPVDTKFVERQAAILRPWLDLVLPAHAVRADEQHFERRYGLKYAEPHLMVRVLDPTLQSELALPWSEFSLPLQALEKLRVSKATVLIVENKVNLLTLPPLHRAIGLGSLGDNITILRSVPWLLHSPIYYWGDLDVEGFEILSSLRSFLPHVQSILMNADTLTHWRSLAVPGTGAAPAVPRDLSSSEQAGFDMCREFNLRLEQERIPQAVVVNVFNQLHLDD